MCNVLTDSLYGLHGMCDRSSSVKHNSLPNTCLQGFALNSWSICLLTVWLYIMVVNMQYAAFEWPPLCRRRFLVELLMSLHDSPLANGHTRRLALHTLTAVPFVPAYAKDLMNRTGNTAAVMHLFLHYSWIFLVFCYVSPRSVLRIICCSWCTLCRSM